MRKQRRQSTHKPQRLHTMTNDDDGDKTWCLGAGSWGWGWKCGGEEDGWRDLAVQAWNFNPRPRQFLAKYIIGWLMVGCGLLQFSISSSSRDRVEVHTCLFTVTWRRRPSPLDWWWLCNMNKYASLILQSIGQSFLGGYAEADNNHCDWLVRRRDIFYLGKEKMYSCNGEEATTVLWLKSKSTDKYWRSKKEFFFNRTGALCTFSIRDRIV